MAVSLFDVRPEPRREDLEWHRWIMARLAPRRADALLERFGGPAEVLAAGAEAWKAAGCTKAESERLNASASPTVAEIQFLTVSDVSVVHRADPTFPSLLRQAGGLPAAFYCRGLPPEADALYVAVCGTRRASPVGLSAAEHFGRELGRAGAVIVTGGSHGVEAMAIRASLDAGGRCVVVLPCGPDTDYPEDHARLFRSVAERGAVLSPFPFGERVLSGNFAERNRFIAALCAAVVVVEAPRGSGSLSVANFANEEGRQVFVLPGPFNSPSYAGNHDLVRLGATLVTSTAQVLDDLGHAYELETLTADPTPLSPEQEKLLAAFDTEPLRLDQVARLAGRPAPSVAVDLTLLEMVGKLSRGAGGTYCLRS